MTDREKEGSCKVWSCIINIAKMQSDCQNTRVLKDFHFVTLVAFTSHLIPWRPQKRPRKSSPKSSKTVPKRSSMSCASWIRFWTGFGTILDLQMAAQKWSLKPPRGSKKRLLFRLASQDVSRMDFARHLNPLGLHLEPFLEAFLT